MTKVSVVETKSGDNGSEPQFDLSHGLVLAETDDTEIKVLKIIQKNPFASIREMQQEINIHSNFHRTSWWRIFRIVKKKGLLSKKSRFRYVRDHL